MGSEAADPEPPYETPTKTLRKPYEQEWVSVSDFWDRLGGYTDTRLPREMNKTFRAPAGLSPALRRGR